MKNSFVLSVTQLNTYIKSLFDADLNLSSVYLRGEISNFTNHYRTGHFYFTLKDSTSAVRAVMFRSNAQLIRFVPENGMSVLVRGRVSVFERDGQYQIYVDDMQPDGIGALSVAYEQLKNKLEAEGLFNPLRKKPLPEIPMSIAVITSPTGAAVQDIMNILGRRFPLARIIMCPVQVQGASAAPQLVAALNRVNALNCADVIIIGRGGGSIEDLWAFNEEPVVRAVAQSRIPVISAVGHETDFTICDFAADLRAPTPSAAAELAVPDFREHKAFCQSAVASCAKAVMSRIKQDKAVLNAICSAPAMKNPMFTVGQLREYTDKTSARAFAAMSTRLNAYKNSFSLLCGKLDALSPLRVLARGYCMTSVGGELIKTVAALKEGESATITFCDGTAECEIKDVNVNEI